MDFFELLPGQRRPEVAIELPYEVNDACLDLVWQLPAPDAAALLGDQPTHAITLVRLAESSHLSSAKPKQLASFHPCEPTLEHLLNQGQAINFFLAHDDQVLRHRYLRCPCGQPTWRREDRTFARGQDRTFSESRYIGKSDNRYYVNYVAFFSAT